MSAAGVHENATTYLRLRTRPVAAREAVRVRTSQCDLLSKPDPALHTIRATHEQVIASDKRAA